MQILRKTFKFIPGTALVGTLAGFFYFLLSGLWLEAQGLYYDELHQAVGAFAYIGRRYSNSTFARLSWNGLPLMNMTYSAAIKTGLYGLYLRLSGAGFSVTSWRLTGILFVTCGMILFGVIARKTLPVNAALVFFFFLLTDQTFLLTTRFDWGPTALAALFRLVFVATWLAGELSPQVRFRNSFWLGLLAGLSIFEKLSSVLLLVALAAIILLGEQRRNKSHILAVILGGLLGCLPLAAVNAYSMATQGNLISFHFYETERALSFWNYAVSFLGMGAGDWARTFVLGQTDNLVGPLEVVVLMLTLAAGFLAARRDRSSPLFKAGGIAMVAYLGILIGFYFFPEGTLPYHWLVGTPFQYAALALFTAASMQGKAGGWGSRAILLLLIIFGLTRIWGVIDLELRLESGQTAIAWDPSLNTLGRFAARKSGQAEFISADWGVGMQMICYVNNYPGEVHELQWDDKNAGSEIADIIKQSPLETVYVVFPNFLSFNTAQSRAEHIQQIYSGLGNSWQSQPVDPELMGLKAVTALKFVKVK